MTDREPVSILIVDDKPENLLALETILDAPEWRVVKAGSGKEALRQVLKEEFAAILLDVQMPEMDGFETATLIRQRDQSAHTPIIFVTAINRTEADAGRGYSLGAVDFIFKPLVPEILKAKVTVFADLFRMRRQIEQQAERLRSANEEISSLNQALERRAAELETLNQEMKTFSYSVSHDLRAPLRGISGFSEIILRDYSARLDKTGRDYLTRITGAAQRMDEMIAALLGLSRVTRQEMSLEAVNLSALVQSLGLELAEEDPERKVKMIIQPGIFARGDPALLRLALQNLVGNAWKFTRKTPEPCVEFGEEMHGCQQVYVVRDNGAGFDMTYSERLFGPFQRLHSENDYSGHGIGLATVQRIIRRHGGRIWAQGAEKKGATFFFTLTPEA